MKRCITAMILCFNLVMLTACSQTTTDISTTAKVYGISGSWTLPVNAHFEKTGGEWRYCN